MNVPTSNGPAWTGPAGAAPAGTGQPAGQITPGKGRYVLGGALILLGLVVFFGVMIFAFVRVIRIVADTTTVYPGLVETKVLDPGTYTLFSESEGAEVTVSGPDGEVDLDPSTNFQWVVTDTFEGEAIYTFDVDKTATFEITNDGESRIAVGGAAWDGFGRTVLFGAIGGAILLIVGIVLLIVTGSQRRKSKRALMAAAVGLPDQYPGWGTGPQQPQYTPQYYPGRTPQSPGQAPPTPPGFAPPPSAGQPPQFPGQPPGQAPQYESGPPNYPPQRP